MSNIYEQFTTQQPALAPVSPLLSPQGQPFQTGLGQPQPFQQQFTQPAAFSLNQPQQYIENEMDFGQALGDNNQAGAATMVVRKVFMGLTRGQLQQHRRSYDVFVDGVTMDQLGNNVERYGISALNADRLAETMSTHNIIKLSGQSEAAVNIPNGWGNDRYMFMMVVDNYRNGKFIRTEFVSGYTNSANVSTLVAGSDARIDPMMEFTINHVSTATQRFKDAHGNPITMIGGTSSVLTNPEFSNFTNTSSDLYMMRPSDILKTVDKVDMHQGMAELAAVTGQDYTGSYRDLDSTLSRLPMTANDTCGLLPTFTSRIVHGLHSNTLPEHDPMRVDNSSPGQMAAMRNVDLPFNQVGFAFVMNRAIANGVTVTSRFTYADLLRLDPGIDKRVSLFGRSYESGVISFPSASGTDSMGSGTSIAVHATHIAQSTLALMSIAGVVTLGFNANNNSGMTEITLQAVEGMDSDGKLANRLEVMKGRLIAECLNMVSENNSWNFSVDIFASAINDMFIKLTWNGDKTEMLYPCFGSAMTLPIVTNDVSRLTDVAAKVGEIVSMLKPPKGNEDTNFVQGNGNATHNLLSGYGTGNSGSF